MFLDCQINGARDDVKLKGFIYLNYVWNHFHIREESLLPQSVTPQKYFTAKMYMQEKIYFIKYFIIFGYET